MATLSATFYKSGTTYNQIQRTGKIAIYSLKRPNSSSIREYQVVVIEANETYPAMNPAVWGNRMSSFDTLADAQFQFSQWVAGNFGTAVSHV